MFDSGLTPLGKTTSLSLLKSVSRAKAWGKVKNEEKASFFCYRFVAEQKIAKKLWRHNLHIVKDLFDEIVPCGNRHGCARRVQMGQS